jgi:hypothetical protein
MFIRREVLPDKEILKQQFKFLTSKDIDSIYNWMEQKKSCIQYGNNSTSCTIQQVYKYSGVIITNDHVSEFRTWAYIYDRYMFQEEYASERKTLIIYEPHHKKLYNKTIKQKK